MAYDETLVVRVRELLRTRDGVSEKKMFGGVAFLIGGNMSCGVLGAELIVRTSPEQAEALLAEPFVRVFDMTGRPMRGWLFVGQEGTESDEVLARFAGLGATHAASLPVKTVKPAQKARPARPAKAVTRAKVAKAAKTVKAAKTAKAAKTVKAAKAANVAKASARAKPRPAAKAAKPARSASRAKPRKAARRAK